jgi:hypothetical protein
LIKNLLKFGGGCVVFMDYSYYAKLDYFTMVKLFNSILRDTLYNKLVSTGHYSRIFMFGYSYGARLAQAAGHKLTMANGGVPQIGDMHLCDPAGPLFDNDDDFERRVNPRLSAKNTQCINTSYGVGTTIYDCTQNFRMGYCGWLQVATQYSLGVRRFK